MNPLDNPIWNSLRTCQRDIAEGSEDALRYPAYIGPLAGIAEETPACYQALHSLLAAPTDVLVTFSPREPQAIPHLQVLRTGAIYQMVRTSRVPAPPIPADLDLRHLTLPDAPEMVALAEATEPGPFRPRTLELGMFYGIFDDGNLVSMAGQRMHLPGFVEVSGVCTYPEARGRGYARLLMSLVIQDIEAAGETPFLHVLTQNPAIHLYESLGFQIRQTLHFAALGTQSAAPNATPHPPVPQRCG